MGINNNVRSAEAVYAWNHSAEVINNAKYKRDYNLNNHVNESNLNAENKNDLLLKLTGKRKTMLEGAVFMKNKGAQFANFERALTLLKSANNAYSLTAVEAALQTQIDAIREMKTPEMTLENKTLCLYTLQNMIFALSDFHLSNGKENDFMPKVLQDQYQMLLKGSNVDLEWDKMYDSVYSTEYHDKNNPTLAEWKFLDDKLIQNNLKNLASYQAVHDETLLSDMAQEKKVEHQQDKGTNGVKFWGTVELNRISDVEINRILNEAMKQFNSKNLKDNLKDFFNFVKDSLVEQNVGEEEVNYRILHEVVLSVMQQIVEIGNDQQKKSMLEQSQAAISQQNNVEERSL